MLSHTPRNYLVNVRYAECLYGAARSTDSLNDLQLARKYFSHAAILKEGAPCLRALYGIVACCKLIAVLLASNKKLEDTKNAAILVAAQKQLRLAY